MSMTNNNNNNNNNNDKSIYNVNGYKNRRHYLKCMSEDYDVPETIVFTLAELLGSKEDFDGLITKLEDFDKSYFDSLLDVDND